MPYRPTIIETQQERFEKAYWPAYFEQQTRTALANQQAQLEAGLAPGGRLRVDAMDPRYRKSELAAKAAAIRSQYADIEKQQREMEIKQALMGPQMENLQARSINQLSSAQERGRRTDLEYAKFGPQMENLQARTDWIGEQKPAIEWDRNALGWAKLKQANAQFKESLKLGWHKGRKKGTGTGKSQEEKFADTFDTFLGDIAKGSTHYGIDAKGNYVLQTAMTPSEIKKGELSSVRVMQEFDRLPTDAKREIWMRTLVATGHGPLVEQYQEQLASGQEPTAELPSMGELVQMAARGEGDPKVETLGEDVAPATGAMTNPEEAERRMLEARRKQRLADYKDRQAKKEKLKGDIYLAQRDLLRLRQRGGIAEVVTGAFRSGPSEADLAAQHLEELQRDLAQLEGIDASGLEGGGF